MTHLKKSRRKLRKRKTIRRKTYKGGAAALNTDQYVWLAQKILETIYEYSYPEFSPKEIDDFTEQIRMKLNDEDDFKTIRYILSINNGATPTKLVENLLQFGIELPKKSSPYLPQQSAAFVQPTEAKMEDEDKNFIAGQVLNILGYDLDRDFTHRDKSVDIYQIRAFAKRIKDVDKLDDILDREYNSRDEVTRTKQKKRLLAELATQGIHVVTDSKFNFNKMKNYLVD